MSGAINNPPAVPLDKGNQFQKGFFPFDAFSADDPNTASAPALTLKTPWKFSALQYTPLQVVAPLSGKIGVNTTYNLPTTYPAQYRIYIPAADLVASSGGPFTLTIQTPAAGASVKVPINASGDTILSGDLLFDVYVDGSGNVISGPWQISGSNSNGNYTQFAEGTMIARGLYSYTRTATYQNVSIPLSTNFSDANYSSSVKQWSASVGSAAFAYNDTGTNTKSAINVTMWVQTGSTSCTATLDWIAIGRWK